MAQGPPPLSRSVAGTPDLCTPATKHSDGDGEWQSQKLAWQQRTDDLTGQLPPKPTHFFSLCQMLWVGLRSPDAVPLTFTPGSAAFGGTWPVP